MSLSFNSSATEHCALGPDGSLLDAKYITWHNDLDDINPLSVALPLVNSAAPHNDVSELQGEYKYIV